MHFAHFDGQAENQLSVYGVVQARGSRVGLSSVTE